MCVAACSRASGPWARLAQKFGLGETALYAHTLDPVHAEVRGELSGHADLRCDGTGGGGRQALAQTLQIAVPTLQAMLALLDQSPELTLTELRTRTALHSQATDRTRRSGDVTRAARSDRRGRTASDHARRCPPGGQSDQCGDAGAPGDVLPAVPPGDSRPAEHEGATADRPSTVSRGDKRRVEEGAPVVLGGGPAELSPRETARRDLLTLERLHIVTPLSPRETVTAPRATPARRPTWPPIRSTRSSRYCSPSQRRRTARIACTGMRACRSASTSKSPPRRSI